MDLLGLSAFDDGRASFVLTRPLVRFDAQLFGGTGLAVAVAAMETVTGRAALWATVQFVGTAREGERLDVAVEELAHGGTTSQLRITASAGDRVVLAGLGSTARERDDGFAAAFGTMPVVAPPEECGPLTFGDFDPPPEMRVRGPFSVGDYRVAPGEHDSRYVWSRVSGVPLSRPLLAYVADFVPSAVLRAAGRLGGGTSLDNAMRFGPTPRSTGDPEDDWVLLDSDPYFAENGFVHGAARIWSRQGTLLAVASQSAVARIFPGS